MIRNLLIISGAGLILAIVGIGGAFAVGGRDLARHDWTWVVTDDNAGDDSFKIERGAVSPGPATSAWPSTCLPTSPTTSRPTSRASPSSAPRPSWTASASPTAA